MIAARWGTLVLTALLVLAAFGVTATELQPSAMRVAVTAVVGLLATLLWPGQAATPARTAARIVVWSLGAAALAAVLLRLLGHAMQPFGRIFASCTMLLLMLLVAHLLAALLEALWRGRSATEDQAREMAGRTVAVALALLGAAPLWLGPMAELLSRRHAGAIDAVVGVSPLAHLAVASGNDLLRNQWFYQHSNLASLQFSYPGLAAVAWTYAALGVLLALGALGLQRARQPSPHPTLTSSLEEPSP